jgi:hypothetical protein
VPSVEGPPPATSRFGPRPSRAIPAPRPARLAGAVLVALALGAGLARAPSVNGAASVASLQSQAATLSAELIEAQLRVDGVAQQYEVAETDVAHDVAAIATTEHQVTQDAGRVAVDHAQLLREALSSYVNSGVADGLSQLFSTNANAIPAQRAYEQIVIGDTTTTIDRLHTAEVLLHQTEGALHQQEAKDHATEAQEAVLTSEAQSSADQLAAEQAQVTTQLAAAIAQQRASVGASAAAARAAAPSRAPSGASSGAPAGAPSGGGAVPQQAASDPALPPFLQCVLQRESGGDYSAVSPDGLYRGGFQFAQGTWNEAANLAGLPGLVGELPNLATKADQDTLAVALYNADGKQPWLDGC